MLNITGIIGSLAKKFIFSDGDLKIHGSLTANNQQSNVILEIFFPLEKCHTYQYDFFNILKYGIDLILLLFGKLQLQMDNSLRLFRSQTALYTTTGL